MATCGVLATEPTRSRGVGAVADAFIALREANRGTGLADVLTDDAVLDLNVSRWRFQAGGGLAIAAAFAESSPAGFRTTGYHWEPTPAGAVVGYDAWDVERKTHYRHLAPLELRDGQIARLTIYCAGEWDPHTLARQRREAPMVDRDQEQTGGAQ